MRLSSPIQVARIVTLLVLALLLLCGGGLVVQQTGLNAGTPRSHDTGVGADLAPPNGSHLPALLESPDAEEASQGVYEHLTALMPGLFLVSLGLLLGAGLAGSAGERHLLELLRLPSVLPLTPAKASLSELEVFRL